MSEKGWKWIGDHLEGQNDDYHFFHMSIVQDWIDTNHLDIAAVSQPPYHSYHTFSTTVSDRLSIIATEPSVFLMVGC